jgi:hypothetical protein
VRLIAIGVTPPPTKLAWCPHAPQQTKSTGRDDLLDHLVGAGKQRLAAMRADGLWAEGGYGGQATPSGHTSVIGAARELCRQLFVLIALPR